MERGGGEAGQIGDHAAAHGHHHVRPSDAGPGEPPTEQLHLLPATWPPPRRGPRTRWAGSPVSTSTSMPAWVTMTARRASGTAAASGGGQLMTGAGADHHVIAPLAEGHGDHFHRSRPAVMPRARTGGADSTLSTTSGAESRSTSTATAATCLVERTADGVQVDQAGGRVLAQERAALAPPHPPGQQLRIGPQPHHHTRAHHEVPIGGGQHHAAGRRDHHRVVGRQGLGQDPGLLGPEGRLTAFGEQLGHGAAGGRHHLGVGVAVAPSQPAGQGAAHGGLPRPHHPHQDDPVNHRTPAAPTPTVSHPARPDSRPGCAGTPRPSHRRTCAAPRRPAPGPSWFRPPPPWPARR